MFWVFFNNHVQQSAPLNILKKLDAITVYHTASLKTALLYATV